MRPESEKIETIEASQRDITLFLQQYTLQQNDSNKETLLKKFLQLPWLIRLTPTQFGLLSAELSAPHIKTLHEHIIKLQPAFLKNSTELTHVCVALPPEKIPIFCDIITSTLQLRGFIDNLQAFCAIFSPHVFLSDAEKKPGLTPEQISTLYAKLTSLIRVDDLIKSLDDFLIIFVQLPTLNEKAALFNAIEDRMPSLISNTHSIQKIAEQLQTNIEAEKSLFLEIRGFIFYQVARNKTQIIEAFYAMLYMISDNYPGEQQDKLNNIIAAALSITSPGKTFDTKKLLEHTKEQIEKEKISSTRLRKSILQLIENIEQGKAIEISYIRGLAQDKNTVRPKFFQTSPKEMEAFENMSMAAHHANPQF